MESLLALDVGNTQTVVGLLHDRRVVRQWRLATHAHTTADEIGLWLRQVLVASGFEPDGLDAVAVASVVPRLDRPLAEGIPSFLGPEPFFVEPGIRTGMPLRVDAPQELGADRLCDAVAAFESWGGPCVVIDFGTAVKWEVVSREGEYLGGVIAPGPGITAEALFARAAKLPQVAMAPPPRTIGKGTVDSIQSGLFYGYVGLVDGITTRVLDEIGPATVVATGGYAPMLAPHCAGIERVEPHLTLLGLRLLWERNRGGTG